MLQKSERPHSAADRANPWQASRDHLTTAEMREQLLEQRFALSTGTAKILAPLAFGELAA